MVYDAARSLMDAEALASTALSEAEENLQLLWAGITMFTHIDRINRYATPLNNLKALLERHNQVGRVKSGPSATASAQAPAGYGREWPDVYGYLEHVLGYSSTDASTGGATAPFGFDPQFHYVNDQPNAELGESTRQALGHLLHTLQERLEASNWTGQTQSTRAINDAFGRYILGTPLTTVHGIGATLRLLDKVKEPKEELVVHSSSADVASLVRDLRSGLGLPTSNGEPATASSIEEAPLPDEALYEAVPSSIKRLWAYYVRAEGFTILRSDPHTAPAVSDDTLIQYRIRRAFPNVAEVERIATYLGANAESLGVKDAESFYNYLFKEYKRDVEVLEDFLTYLNGGVVCRLYMPCSGVDPDDARAYRNGLYNLLQDNTFQSAMNPAGESINPPSYMREEAWFTLFREKILPLLAIKGWNRIG